MNIEELYKRDCLNTIIESLNKKQTMYYFYISIAGLLFVRDFYKKRDLSNSDVSSIIPLVSEELFKYNYKIYKNNLVEHSLHKIIVLRLDVKQWT